MATARIFILVHSFIYYYRAKIYLTKIPTQVDCYRKQLLYCDRLC